MKNIKRLSESQLNRIIKNVISDFYYEFISNTKRWTNLL